LRLPFLALLLCTSAVAASSQDVFLYKTATHLVDLTISVHDANGGLVPGLTRDDFTVAEDGVPQQIRFFAQPAQLPLSIGIVVDASGSQEAFVKAHEKDVETFVRSVLAPGDEAFAVCFGNHLRLVSDFTGSADTLVSGLQRFDKGSRTFPEIGPDEDRELGTALYDAVWFGIAEKLVNRPQHRKVLLIMSDGEDNSSEHDLLDAIEEAQNNNVVLYAVRYTDAKHDEFSARDRYGVRALDHLTAQTGGKTYDVHKVKMEQAFAEIAGEVRSLYDLAYQSTNRERDGTFRKVEIRALRPELKVRSRAGYYAR
jgi:Ca-activated chloride channel family protein